VVAVALVVAGAACNGDRRASGANNSTGSRDTGSAVGTTGANAERRFIEDQLEDSQAEVTLGRIASEKVTDPQVREFAQMMVRDYEKAAEELRQLAARAGVQVSTPKPDRDHSEIQEDLTKLSGHDFDRKYIDAMVDEHEDTVRELQKKADSTTAEVHDWVAKTLPTMRQHLERARQLKQSLEQTH
jgi:putative membrane protein